MHNLILWWLKPIFNRLSDVTLTTLLMYRRQYRMVEVDTEPEDREYLPTKFGCYKVKLSNGEIRTLWYHPHSDINRWYSEEPTWGKDNNIDVGEGMLIKSTTGKENFMISWEHA